MVEANWSIVEELPQNLSAEIGALVSSTGFFSQEEENIAVELVRERLSDGLTSGYEFILVRDSTNGGELLGYTCFGEIPGTAGSYDLYWIVVSPRTQRLGLGCLLLQETEARIRQRGSRALYAETSGRSLYAPTRGFYEKNGYVCLAKFKDFYRIGDDKLVYVKYLSMQNT